MILIFLKIPTRRLETYRSIIRRSYVTFLLGVMNTRGPDKADFKKRDLDKPIDGWEGDRRLNVRWQNARNIMKTRLDLAMEKNCDGVEPDNVDGYGNENELKFTEDYAIDYMKFLTTEAHNRNQSIGLKNAGGIVDNVVELVDWSIQEQYIRYE